MHLFFIGVAVKHSTCVRIVLLYIALSMVCNANAQGLMHIQPRHATTYEWSVLARLQLLDETHAYNEPFYDRGFNRVLTPLVKSEYELDIWTQDYQFNEAFSWFQHPQGFRTRFGSYSKGSLAIFSELHTMVAVGRDSDIQINFYAHQHARAARALVEIGYQHTFNQHKVSVLHTLSEYKKDLDFTLAYQTSSETRGEFTLDFTILNYLNNLVNTIGNEDPKHEGVRQLQTSYKTFPAFFFGRYRTNPDRFYHVDLSFGWQPNRKDVITDKMLPAFRYEQQRAVSFVNASIEVSTSYSTLGIFHYYDHDFLTRSASADPFEGAYSARQRSQKLGAFWYGYFNKFRPFLRISRESYSDRQSGDDFSISIIPQKLNYDESKWIIDAGLNIQPFEVPFFAEFRYMSMNRDKLEMLASKQLGDEWTKQYFFNVPHNNRLVCSINFNASNTLHLEIGAAYDIDGDTHQYNDVVKRFDKGFAKLIVWF